MLILGKEGALRLDFRPLLADNRKIRELTGWEPEYSLDEGLIRTIDWLKANLKHYKSNIHNM